MNTKETFEQDIKNIPFINCINKDHLYDEYRNTEKKPDYSLYIQYIGERENLERLESLERKRLMEQYGDGKTYLVSGMNQYDLKLQELKIKFSEKLINKDLPIECFRHQITLTPTYRGLNKINDIYNNFFSTLRNKINEINRYKEPEAHADSIIREIHFFPYETQIKIIDNIINPDNELSEYIRMKYTNPNYTKDNESILNIFKNHLFKYKSTLVNDSPKESINTSSQNTQTEKHGIDTNLLTYLSENFISADKRFKNLTKYNHIYRFLNKDRDYNIEHRAYKILIKELFNFDYGSSEIKGETKKHMDQLDRLEYNYKNSTK
ncbi:hypothetical protein M2T70_04725 [Elizabethkingia anophelis]|uniref:hypothetical protein n=1 Tax=Elizabethkingia anophelis TaxID=1117645 RepID=UPI000BA8B483|nr:hypothetical protein [Elizabethkingia anophelis]ASV77963.1 hypothetical protein A6J37_04640 [Elizabethkingia anophelis]MCL1648248.1 hypothetical protein [Elizabethkingia anophelis]MCL1683642.1 hypothetical protein [Elizabethkingia anophelis]MDV3460750.1 hypothetical protein [Elizabethkingia anophelis]MDV3571621.1 hypothetical protein [Elizabethkingia anophelis]